MTKTTSLPARRRALKEHGKKKKANLSVTTKTERVRMNAIQKTPPATPSTPQRHRRRRLGIIGVDLTGSDKGTDLIQKYQIHKPRENSSSTPGPSTDETEHYNERALSLFQNYSQRLRFGSDNAVRRFLPSPTDSFSPCDLETPVKSTVARNPKAHIKGASTSKQACSNRTPVVRKSSYAQDGLEITSCRIKLSSPRNVHMWTHQERQLLCLVRRFFNTNSHKIADIMNAIFPKNLNKFRASMISAQMHEMNTGSSGRDGEAAFSSIWGVANFNEALSVFGPDLDQIEVICEENGIAIERRKVEDEKQVHGQPHSGSKGRREIRQLDRDLVPGIGTEALSHCSPGTVGSSVSAHESIPKILFRAFSEQSSGTNTEDSMRAGLFSDFVPSPIDSNGDMFACIAQTHLTRKPIATPFISTSPSLVWVLHKLLKTESNIKNIAIIDGHRANADTRVYPAHPILRDLRQRHMYPKNIQYKGRMEYLIWGEVLREAIYGVVGIQHLEHLAGSSAAVGRFLRLDALKDSIDVATARQKFFDDTVVLNGQVGYAIAKIILLFGYSPESEEAAITDMIFHLLQGWAVKVPMDDDESLLQAFGGFLVVFTAAIGGITLAVAILEQKLRRAFDNGVHQAAQAMVKDSMNRPNGRNRRNISKFFVRNV